MKKDIAIKYDGKVISPRDFAVLESDSFKLFLDKYCAENNISYFDMFYMLNMPKLDIINKFYEISASMIEDGGDKFYKIIDEINLDNLLEM